MIRITAPMARAIMVAVAAPATPIAGNGPRPKIRSGSRAILLKADTIMTTLGRIGFPSALIIVPVIIAKEFTTAKVARIDI